MELIEAHNGKIVLHVRITSFTRFRVSSQPLALQGIAENIVKATDARIKNEFVGIFTFDEVEAGEPKICHLKAFVDTSATKELEAYAEETERQDNLKNE